MGAPKKKKMKTPVDPNAPPPPPLEPDVVQRITGHLDSHGGTMRLGKLATVFEGIKKSQLEPHFNVFLVEGQNGECAISLDPTLGPGMPLPPGVASSTAGGASAAPPGGGGCSGLELGLGLGLGGLGDGGRPEAREAGNKKKHKKTRDPDAPPPMPLEESAVLEIRDFLLKQGGSIMLGRLATRFEGLKKTQLEPHFQVVPEGNSGNFIVYVDAEAAAMAMGAGGNELH